MSMRLAATAAVLAALVLPASAAAKEITKVTICGQGGCHSTDDADRLAALPVGGTPTDPPRAAPFYRVTVHMRENRAMSFRMYFLPRPGLDATFDAPGRRPRVARTRPQALPRHEAAVQPHAAPERHAGPDRDADRRRYRRGQLPVADRHRRRRRHRRRSTGAPAALACPGAGDRVMCLIG
jgi:hypothetical protein